MKKVRDKGLMIRRSDIEGWSWHKYWLGTKRTGLTCLYSSSSSSSSCVSILVQSCVACVLLLFFLCLCFLSLIKCFLNLMNLNLWYLWISETHWIKIICVNVKNYYGTVRMYSEAWQNVHVSFYTEKVLRLELVGFVRWEIGKIRKSCSNLPKWFIILSKFNRIVVHFITAALSKAIGIIINLFANY